MSARLQSLPGVSTDLGSAIARKRVGGSAGHWLLAWRQGGCLAAGGSTLAEERNIGFLLTLAGGQGSGSGRCIGGRAAGLPVCLPTGRENGHW